MSIIGNFRIALFLRPYLCLSDVQTIYYRNRLDFKTTRTSVSTTSNAISNNMMLSERRIHHSPNSSAENERQDHSDCVDIELSKDDRYFQISIPQSSFKKYLDSDVKTNNKSLNIANSNNETKDNDNNNNDTCIPESVLQYERQIRKMQAAKRASTPLSKSQLNIIYNDKNVIVALKPNGVLTVPGINTNPSLLTLIYEEYKNDIETSLQMDQMIIHRLDMYVVASNVVLSILKETTQL